MTSYTTLGQDFKKSEKDNAPKFFLFGIDWHRIILDEAHAIKGVRSLQSRACCQLKAKCRWFVTGTPVQNDLTDLYAALKFLRIKPLDEPVEFKNEVQKPFSATHNIYRNGQQVAEYYDRDRVVENIRNLLSPLMLRRTKAQDMTNLPKRTIIKKRVKFTDIGLESYNMIRKAEGVSLRNIGIDVGADVTALMRSYLSIMGALTKMRKCCNSYHTVKDHIEGLRQIEEKGVDLDKLKKPTATKKTMNAAEKQRLQEILDVVFISDPDAQCKVCCNKFDEKTVSISACEHVGCYDCLQEVVKSNGKCPTCNKVLKAKHIFKLRQENSNNWLFESEETEESEPLEASQSDDRSNWSSKLETIIELTEKHFSDPKNGKIVIVSQFLDFLSEIGQKLNRIETASGGYRVFVFNGSMTEKKRSATLDSFQDEKAKTKDILLLALVSGSVGLNLTAANTMIISEPNWNPGREAQCQDRIYRIGQTRPVHVYKLYVSGSIERRMLAMQCAKRHIMEAVCSNMGGKPAADKGDAKAQRLKDMQAILAHVFDGPNNDDISDDEDEIELDELGNKIIQK